MKVCYFITRRIIMDSQNLGNTGKTIIGIFLIIFGAVIFFLSITLSNRIPENMGVILFVGISCSSLLISKGIGMAFMNDQLKDSIVINGRTTYTTVKTSKYLMRKMIVCFFDAIAFFVSAIVTICTYQEIISIFFCAILAVASIICLLLALASKGDLKKIE